MSVVGGQPASAARPLVLPFRSCHFHLLRVLRRVLIRTLDPRQHAVMLCALPLLSFTLSISFPSVSQSHLITSIQFSLFFIFLFYFTSSCLVAASTDDVENSWDHQYSFSFFDSYCVSISVTICNPLYVLLHFILFLVLFCLALSFRFSPFLDVSYFLFKFFLFLNPLPVSYSPSFYFL